ncbi:hypothetical protein BX661DRAFT_225668 [Kickxella alabastrina]|uniref:uncharacterized protein n=1 Tax=Kickxella alabastrina TaxID=61397 RepID=UPI00221E6B6F|nr:uncharacterized protein BX661DRAFT_225668 [Kickxella alabastrina]KAI7825068.1 hypothetical protein BX661DRAFT_225668 [Kickxella alabastrina]
MCDFVPVILAYGIDANGYSLGERKVKVETYEMTIGEFKKRVAAAFDVPWDRVSLYYGLHKGQRLELIPEY